MTIKARKPHFDEPFSYDKAAAHHIIVSSLVFIGNINAEPSWTRPGSTFTRLEVLGVTSRRHNSNRVGPGFRPGDAFLHYGTGEGLVIARGRSPRGRYVYQMRSLKPTERTMLAIGIKAAERDLRWRRNSYCEHTRRVAAR